MDVALGGPGLGLWLSLNDVLGDGKVDIRVVDKTKGAIPR